MFNDVRQRNIPVHNFFCNTAVRTLNFKVFKRLSQGYILNVVRPVRIPVSVGCSWHDIIIFLHSAKAVYCHLCFYIGGVFIIQRAFTRQRCEGTQSLSVGVLFICNGLKKE